MSISEKVIIDNQKFIEYFKRKEFYESVYKKKHRKIKKI